MSCGTKKVLDGKLFFDYLKAGPADGLAPADGAAGRRGEPAAFFEGKTTGVAHGREDMEALAGPGSLGNVGQMFQHLLFRNAEALGKLQGRKGLLLKQVFDSLTDGRHGN